MFDPYNLNDPFGYSLDYPFGDPFGNNISEETTSPSNEKYSWEMSNFDSFHNTENNTNERLNYDDNMKLNKDSMRRLRQHRNDFNEFESLQQNDNFNPPQEIISPLSS